MKKLAVLIPHFGAPVPWFQFFLASCARNPGIDWYIVSDYPLGRCPPNVKHVETAFADYVARASGVLNLPLAWTEPYRLCDLKPMLGLIHKDIIRDYAFWGYGDIDLVYGNVLQIYEPLMAEHDVVSSHTYLLSGHFAVFRTLPETLTLFAQAPRWRAFLTGPTYANFDEIVLTRALLRHQNVEEFRFAPILRFSRMIGSRRLRFLFKEQHTTFNTPWLMPDGRFAMPGCWSWNDGELRCDVIDGPRPYGHFSLWHSGRYALPGNPEAGTWRHTEAWPAHIPFDQIENFTVTAQGFATRP